MSTEETRSIVKELMDRLDQRDIDGLLAYASPNAAWHGFAPNALDNQGYRQAIQAFLDAFPDSRFPVDRIVADGDHAVAQHSLKGTHLAPFQGVLASGRQVTVPAMAAFRVKNGKVVETWMNADLLGLLAQIGAIPSPA
jgi:predicted ester cyclase